MNKQCGFTFIELLVTLAVAAILATIGIPNIMELLQNNRITNTTNDFLSAVNYARGEAITVRDNINITPIDDSDSQNEWAKGWIVWRDQAANTAAATNGNNQYDNAADPNDDETLRVFSGDGIVIFNGPDTLDAQRTTAVTDTNTLSFNADGMLNSTAATAVFSVCDERDNEAITEITLHRTGRAVARKIYFGQARYRACP